MDPETGSRGVAAAAGDSPGVAVELASMLRFDHLVIAVRDLSATVTMFRDQLGFAVTPGGRHKGFGTHNAIVRFGLDYLELLAVENEALAVQSNRGTLVRYLRDHECGLVAFALASDDLDGLATSFKQAGLEAVGPFPMRRQRPDGSVLTWRLLVPGGGSYCQTWPFFIQWDQADSERLAVETAGPHSNAACAVSGVIMDVKVLNSARACYDTLGLPARVDSGAIDY